MNSHKAFFAAVLRVLVLGLVLGCDSLGSSPAYVESGGVITAKSEKDKSQFVYRKSGQASIEGFIYASLPISGIGYTAGAKRLLWILGERDYQQFVAQYGKGGKCPDSFLKPRIKSLTLVTDKKEIEKWAGRLSKGDRVTLNGTYLELIEGEMGGGKLRNPKSLAADNFGSRYVWVERVVN